MHLSSCSIARRPLTLQQRYRLSCSSQALKSGVAQKCNNRRTQSLVVARRCINSRLLCSSPSPSCQAASSPVTLLIIIVVVVSTAPKSFLKHAFAHSHPPTRFRTAQDHSFTHHHNHHRHHHQQHHHSHPAPQPTTATSSSQKPPHHQTTTSNCHPVSTSSARPSCAKSP